ncbi:MAG: hypothetical protein ACI85K_001760 [Hyphomicrobiaceae bacterium]
MSETNENELLRQQFCELEARVARLESERAASEGSHPVDAPAAELSAEPAAEPQLEQPSEPRQLAAWPPPIPEAVGGARATQAPSEPKSNHASERKARAETKRRDLEQFFGLTVLGRVGIAAVVLAAAYFGQLGWVDLGPAARTALVYVFGAALVVLGTVLRRRVDERYVALMWGGGVAVTYVAGVLAHLRYEVMPSWAALVSLLLTAALGQFLARRLRLEVMATVALGGAYLAPVLVGTPAATPTAYFVLLLALHSWAAWIEHRWQWRKARALAVILTLALVVGWYAEYGIVTPWSFLWHMQVVWLLVTLPELMRAASRQVVGQGRCYAVFSIGLAFSIAATCPTNMVEGSALVVGLALLAIGAWLVPRHRLMGQCLARIPAFLLACAAMNWWVISYGSYGSSDAHDEYVRYRDDEWVFVVALAVVGLLQLGARRWTQVGELGAAVAASLAFLYLLTPGAQEPGLTLAQAPLAVVLPLALLWLARVSAGQIAGFLLAIGTCLVAVLFASAPPIVGSELVALALVSATAIATFGTWTSARREALQLGVIATLVHAVLLAAWLIYCARIEPVAGAAAPIAFWNVRFLALTILVALVSFARSRLPIKDGEQRVVLGIVLLVASYIGGLLEVLDFSADWAFGPKAAATSLYSLLFASVLLVAGFLRQMLELRWIALALFAGVAIKVAGYDLSQAKTPVRVLVTGVLGGVLLVVAWGYARRKRQESGGS